MSLSDDLKKAIRASGLNISEISRKSGVSRPTVIRFLAEGDKHSDIRMEAAGDKLAACFGLELTGPADTTPAAIAKPVKKKTRPRK